MSTLPTGVAAIADAVAGGKVTATSVIADHLTKSEQIQQDLNAYTLLDHEGALAAAATIDRRIQEGQEVGPLAGVPLALKDLMDHAGYPNTAGSNAEPPPRPTIIRSQAPYWSR